MSAYLTALSSRLSDAECAEIARSCEQHIRTWSGYVGVTPETLAANVHDFRILGDNDRIRVAVLLTKMPSMAVTTDDGVRWYRKDMAPEHAWSAAA
jgi:hypothetical protein